MHSYKDKKREEFLAFARSLPDPGTTALATAELPYRADRHDQGAAYLREASVEMQELEDAAAERLPGIYDMLEVVERFDAANAGAATYAEFVQNAVYFTATDTTEG
jgi:hypothetical protein